MELNFLRNILHDLQTRFNSKFSSNDFYLQRELLLLSEMEKKLIRKKVLSFDYNVGALKVLNLLNECKILSLTEFLQNIENEEEVQAIIADLIDVDVTNKQLAEVIEAADTSEAIARQFDVCFRQYCLDCIDRPELIKNEFIGRIEEQLPIEVYCNLIVIKLIDLLINHEVFKEVDVTEVIGKQKGWNKEFENEKFNLLAGIIKNISNNHSESILKHVMKAVQSSKVNWFYLLFVIKLTKHTTLVDNEIKHVLKSFFKKFIELHELNHLITMLILARQLYFFKSDNVAEYKSWLKSTIGEMHWELKSQEKFTQTIEALQSIIFYETDVDVLDLHVQTAISAPRGLNHLVHEYKQLLRTRVASFAKPEIIMDLTS